VLITARLEEATVKELVGELLPIKILLSDDNEEGRGRWIAIEPARQVDFIAGEGLRVEAAGQLQWTAAGLPIGLTFNSAQIMLRPSVEDDSLVFRPALEALDLKNVPAIIDSGLVSLINTRLATQTSDLVWHFGKSIAFDFPLPPTIVPLERLRLGVRDGKVEVLADAIVFSMSVTVAFTRA
jgi:hypothetical protein